MGNAGRIRYACIIAASALLAPEAQAQTTNCRWIGSTWNCNSIPAPQSQPIPPIQAPNGGTMLDAYRSGKEDRRREQDLAVPRPATNDTPDMRTGNGYLEACTSENVDIEFSCINFTIGLFEGIQGGIAAVDAKQIFCSPSGATVGQMLDVVVKYIRDNPDIRHLPTSVIAAFSLKRAFPCPEK